jgi:glycosyltransferase involved in cell wall biosynthesis
MKILFIEQFSELGGGQRNLLDLLPAVMNRGWKATVAAPGSGELFERARSLGAETVRIALGNYSAGRKTAGDAARFVIDTLALGRWIARQSCDLISVGGARLMPGIARGARGRPVIFQAQHFLGKSYAVRLAARAIRDTNATVIANSEHVASQYRTLPSAPGIHAPVRVVYNGTAEIPFAGRRRGPFARIGVIGRIAPMKGQADFLRAAELITHELITSKLPAAKFVICGSPMFTPQAYTDEVDQLAKGLPVEFLGWRDDVGEVLADLDLLIAPSTAAEATTRVILEAFSAGVPVVAYAIGGIPEIVRDGENGFLVPECEPAALARKIIEVLRMNREDLGRVVRRARADWQQRFTIDRYQREMTDVMAEVMGQVIRARETTTGRLRSASG